MHLPLNNHLQKLNLNEMNDQTLRKERLQFEAKWNFYNNIRTAIGFFVNLILLFVLTFQ